MHYRILLSCLVVCAGVSACSGASTPGNSAAGGTSASFSGGSSGLGNGGTGGSAISTGGANGGTPASGGSATGGSGLAGSGGSKGGALTGGTSTASTGGSATGGSSVVGTGGTSTVGNGGTIIGSSGGISSSAGINASGGRVGSGGTTTTGTGGISSSGGRMGTGGTTATGGISASGGSTGGKTDQGSLPSITVHLAGDSTMANYAATTTQEGWGQEFGQFFISKVTIDNQAQGGANVQTFYAGKWKTLIANVQAGDYVLAAFGINDSGTTHGPVSVADFTAEFNTMADEVAAKKATFIPTTSSPLQVWVGGKETNDRLQPYCDATIAMGKAKGLLVDDLNAAGVAYYNSIGQTAAAALTFNGDKAHFDKAGATAMAQLAAQELTQIGSPLAAYLK